MHMRGNRRRRAGSVLPGVAPVNLQREVSRMEQRHKNALRRILHFLLKAVVEAVIQAIMHNLLG
jgi:hypothetical protein